MKTMEATDTKQSSLKGGRKEQEKLLTEADSGTSQSYGRGAAENTSSPEAGSLDSSASNPLTPHTTLKDKYLKSLNEEETPLKASCKKQALKVVVTVLFIIIVVGIVIIWTLHEGRAKKQLGNQYFDFISSKREFNVYSDKDAIIFSGKLRESHYDIGKVKKCYDTEAEDDICFIFGDGAILKFFPHKLGKLEDVNCADIVWDNVKSASQFPTDCYQIGHGSWYGIPSMKGPFWPVSPEQSSFDEISYRPFSEDILGNILENLWVNTNGIAFIAHQRAPIQLSFNSQGDRKACISLDEKHILTDIQTINYTICLGPNIKETLLAVRNAYLPTSPAIDIAKHDFSKIVWKYENKYDTSLGNFGRFLHKLNTLELPIHTVQYSNDWEDHAGNFKLNVLTRNKLAAHLKGKYSNTKLILPLTLSCSYLSDNFKYGVGNNLFASDVQTGALKAILYEEQSCALWDSSNPDTRAFLKDSMNMLQQRNTLEETAYPQGFNFLTQISNKAFPITLFKNSSDVNAINVYFAEFLLSLNKTVLMQSAYQMQNLMVFVEVPTNVVNKDGKKCLDYMIPAALTAGIHGYPYVMTVAPSEEKVDEELYMRWLQVAMFFPGLKVTNAALSFGQMTSILAKNMSQYREHFIIPLLVDAVRDVDKGIPLIRPMWWIDPLDYKTYRISDQFLIGDSVMVAPILCHGDRTRDIYLPDGQWKASKTGEIYDGLKYLRDYPIGLQEIAVFEMIDKPEDEDNVYELSNNL